MSSSGDSFDSWSEQVDSTQGTSSASNLSSSSRSQSAGSVLGITPGFSTPHESEGFASSTSSSYDPILGHFALHTPLASSAAPLSQPLSKPNTLSSDETTESGETGFHSAESNPKRAVWALGTPATSEASQEAENPPTVYQDNAALATPIDLALVGLELRDEYQAEPLFCDANNVNHADIVNEILEILENEHTSHQAKTNAIPWIPGTQDVQWPAFDDSILAPAPGLTYLKYYSPTRTHTQKHRRHEKKTQRKRKATVTCPNTQSTPLGFPSNITVTGTPEYDPEITPHIPSQRSMVWTESQSRRQQDLFNGSAEWLQGTSKQSQICRAVDCVNFSPEILGSIFLPSFALAHLSPSSLSNFTSKLIAPNGLAYNFEYTIDLTLGFGPTMTHNVCAFAPRNGEELQSYQKHQGEDELYVQGSLPIVLNLFSLDSHAEELDAWLDGIIDSELGLQEYIELMQRRQNEHLFIEVLRCLAAWYSTSKNKVSPLFGYLKFPYPVRLSYAGCLDRC
ncbi:hypothetical protein BGZ60DRAFT_146661 [Tricladium varicosporioides]|nr:hypothetical protein BGZ60DRAFT_146661 [Hymenoscyphus varicosporioides]